MSPETFLFGLCTGTAMGKLGLNMGAFFVKPSKITRNMDKMIIVTLGNLAPGLVAAHPASDPGEVLVWREGEGRQSSVIMIIMTS